VERNDVPAGTVAGTAPPASSPIGPSDKITLQVAQPVPPSASPTPTPTPTTTTTTATTTG
jgi:serine/threonine-protein kinase